MQSHCMSEEKASPKSSSSQWRWSTWRSPSSESVQRPPPCLHWASWSSARSSRLSCDLDCRLGLHFPHLFSEMKMSLSVQYVKFCHLVVRFSIAALMRWTSPFFLMYSTHWWSTDDSIAVVCLPHALSYRSYRLLFRRTSQSLMWQDLFPWNSTHFFFQSFKTNHVLFFLLHSCVFSHQRTRQR